MLVKERQGDIYAHKMHICLLSTVFSMEDIFCMHLNVTFRIRIIEYDVYHHFQQYFSCIVAASFISGGN